MPLYNVPLQGGGSIQVNASSPEAAAANVQSGGNSSNPFGAAGAATQVGGGSSGGSSGGGGSPSLPTPGASGEQTLTNLPANQALLQAAANAAQQAYLNSKLALDTDELAFKKAQQAWQNAMSERQQTFSEGQSQASTALDYLKLGSQLTGPANAFRYARMLSGTPGGLRDIVNAAAGRYVLPRSGAGDASVQGERMSLGSLAADAGAGGAGMMAYGTGGPPTGGNPLGTYTVANTPMETLPAGASGSGPYTYGGSAGGGPMYAARGDSPYAAGVPDVTLPNPNQVNLRNYGAMLPGQKALLLAAYQDQGWDPADVDKMIAQSAPRYSGPSVGRVQF